MAATWKTQAAPTFDAVLRAAQAANVSAAAGFDKITTAAGGAVDDFSAGVMNEAKMGLMNLDTDQSREQYLLDNPSSFYDVKELSTFREGLLKTDVSRKEEGDRLKVLEQSNYLEQFEHDPDLQAEKLSEIQKDNAFNGIFDKNKVLTARTDFLIGNKDIEITPQSIKDAGGELGPNGQPVEGSLDPHVMQTLSDNNIKKLKKQFYGASDKTIREMNKRAFDKSQYGAQFTRRGKTVTEMSTEDFQAHEHAGAISDALFNGNPEELEQAVIASSKWELENQTTLTTEQKGFIMAPLLQALDNFTTDEIGPDGKPLLLDAKTEWDKAVGVGGDGSVANQNKFGRYMTNLYRSKYKFLKQEVIDKQIGKIIDNSDNLRNLFDKGNLLAKYKTDLHKEYMEGVKGVKKDLYNTLNRFRIVGSVPAVIAQDLEAILNKTLKGVKDEDNVIRDKIQADLTRNVRNTYNNIKGLFTNQEGTPETNPNWGKSNLTTTQQATLDISIYKMLKAYGGINSRWGWIPWNDPEFTIKVGDGNDMDTATPMELMELVKEFLPPVRDRGGKARQPGAELVERKIAQVQRGLTGDDATTPHSKSTWQKITKKFTPDMKKEIKAQFPLTWWDDSTWWPWLKEKYQGSPEEKIINNMYQSIFGK